MKGFTYSKKRKHVPIEIREVREYGNRVLTNSADLTRPYYHNKKNFNYDELAEQSKNLMVKVGKIVKPFSKYGVR